MGTISELYAPDDERINSKQKILETLTEIDVTEKWLCLDVNSRNEYQRDSRIEGLFDKETFKDNGRKLIYLSKTLKSEN